MSVGGSAAAPPDTPHRSPESDVCGIDCAGKPALEKSVANASS